ncbi:MAG: acyltransferase [Terriglobales bacterium]
MYSIPNSEPTAGASGEPRPNPGKWAAKAVIRSLSRLAVLPAAAAAGFGRWEPAFEFFGQLLSIVPGLPGDYLRAAYLGMTLRECPPDVRVCFGTRFTHAAASLGRGVFIGDFCSLGHCQVGARTLIASNVQILSGRHQHGRTPDGTVFGGDAGRFTQVRIGEDCWIGASAIVMADVGARSTVGAGAVVTRPVPSDTVVVGNPARPLLKSTGSALGAGR